MIRLQSNNGCFVHPRTNSLSDSVEVVIVARGTLSRNYYQGSQLVCWSTDGTAPDVQVATSNKQASRCMDCTQSIKRGGYNRGSACKFYTVLTVAFPEDNIVCDLRISALSLFSTTVNRLSWYKYIEYLERNEADRQVTIRIIIKASLFKKILKKKIKENNIIKNIPPIRVVE